MLRQMSEETVAKSTKRDEAFKLIQGQSERQKNSVSQSWSDRGGEGDFLII